MCVCVCVCVCVSVSEWCLGLVKISQIRTRCGSDLVHLVHHHPTDLCGVYYGDKRGGSVWCILR